MEYTEMSASMGWNSAKVFITEMNTYKCIAEIELNGSRLKFIDYRNRNNDFYAEMDRDIHEINMSHVEQDWWYINDYLLMIAKLFL